MNFDDNKIIWFYKNGYSINYISNLYLKYLNRRNKTITINGVVLYPKQKYKKSEAVMYVYDVLYDYIQNNSNII